MVHLTSPVRDRRSVLHLGVLTVGVVVASALLFLLLRDAHLQREATWVTSCRAEGGWVETVSGPTNPLVVGSDAPTRTCWSADGRVLDRRR